MKKIVLALILLPTICFSTTWDEPWHKKVIEEAEVLIFAEVISSTDSTTTLEVIRDFDGQIEGQIVLKGFYLLDLCSISGGHRPQFEVEEGSQGYYFLKHTEKNIYKLPTPSSGYAQLNEDGVYATFRHSYHQALLPAEDYEMLYEAIWSHYKGRDYDEPKIQSYFARYLNEEVAGFEEDEIETFFHQHAVLETAYLLGVQIDYSKLISFIESDNFHAQVSGLRALGVHSTNEAKNFLLEYVIAQKGDEFTQVIAIWTLWRLHDRKYRRSLWKIKEGLSDEVLGFGGAIMDPRVCTYFPSPRSAIIDLREGHK